jgi:hypothetical protein
MDKFYAKALTSQEIVGYAERFVYTKLRFLAQSYGFSMKELHRHVITSAYGAYLKQYPVFENYDHLLKLAKVAIHNSGINLILKETSDKRNKLVQLEDGSYSAVVSSLTDNNLSFNAAEDGYTRTSYLVTGLDGAVASEWESVFALRELLASNKLTPRHKKFLHLMLNHPSIDFQEYLGADQDDLYNQNFNTYQKKVMQFMNIQPSAAERFLESLKPLL